MFLAKRIFILFFLICFKHDGYSKDKTNIYLFHGQGSDYRIFDSIKIDTNYRLNFIEYGIPNKNESLNDFAIRLSSQIDTNSPYVFIGVSMGGMICVELTELLNPEKTIIISSAKNFNELPFRYKFQKKVPIYKIIPRGLIKQSALILQPIVEPDRNKNKKLFQEMLKSKSPLYMKRTVALIINWDRIENSKNIYHIHGEDDHTLPARKIKNINYLLKKGSHMITLTRSEEISKIINSILVKV